MIRKQYPGIEFEKGWRNQILDSLSLEKRNILVWDDQITVASSSSSAADLFTKLSNHNNLTVIYLVQNVYNQRKSQRTISINSNYRLVYRSGRDASQFCTMANQICPNNGKWLVDSFTDASSKPYKFLVLDHHTSTPEDQTVVTNILFKDQLIYYINSNAKVKRH